MPSHLINRTNSDSASSTGQEQSHEGRQSPTLVAGLDELIADLVSSNALLLAPPADPTLYERLNHRYTEVRQIRRHIANELRRLQRQVAITFQHVPYGRLVVLMLQLRAYRQREAELLARIRAFQNAMGHANVHPDTIDSSEDEEEVFGQDPAPFLDYGSDDEPELMPCMEGVEALLRDPRQQRRPARVRSTERARALENSSLVTSGAMGAVSYPRAGLQDYRWSARSALEAFIIHLAPEVGIEESASDSDESSSDDSEEDEDEERRRRGIEPDFAPEDPLSSDSDGPQTEANENGTDPEQPARWQNFHQYFMYSCRGEVSAVTCRLQETFQFEPETSRIWVGRQLNRSENIRQQIEYLETYLPGETGTLERAEARQRMVQSGIFIQDVYDGKSAGQIFDIDLTSDAYIEPIQPADLPTTWTPLLDATLLTVLPDIPDMKAFWLENASILREMFEDGIGWSRKERALNLRCGQLQYLRLSAEQLAAGRDREQARIDSWYGDETDEMEAADEEEVSA
jgi:hypothetical protein